LKVLSSALFEKIYTYSKRFLCKLRNWYRGTIVTLCRTKENLTCHNKIYQLGHSMSDEQIFRQLSVLEFTDQNPEMLSFIGHWLQVHYIVLLCSTTLF